MSAPEPIIRLNTALEGRYRIESELGEGGMATVFLAADLKHERKVALKVLKPELAAVVGAERFLAEIKTTANLQHPHILPLFDSGEADGFLFYVMPYVEGETLRERIDRERQLPVDEALGIATAVAGALEAAHARGVIHRDIKPGNILLSRGQPLVADFGIALAVSAGGAGRLTETGLSLGTPYYMSPEQATGDQAVGPASDTFALACVLYEMLVGEPPYPGSTAQAVLGKIIQGLPVSATAVRSTVPVNVDAAICRALEKLPADRFSGVDEFAKALSDTAFRHGPGVAGQVDSALRASGWRWAAVVFALTTVIAAMLAVRATSRSDGGPVAEFAIVTELDVEFTNVRGVELALSPDGSIVAFRATGDHGGSLVYLRRLDGLGVTPVPGTEEAGTPSFSPDGRSLLYGQDGELIVRPLDGAPPYVVGEGGAGAWGDDGFIYHEYQGVIGRQPEGSGDLEPFTRSDGGFHRYPYPLPEGRGILFTLAGDDPTGSRVAVAGPDGQPVELLAGTMGMYSTTGHIVYATADGAIRAAPFDLDRLELTGPSFGVLSGVQIKGGSASQFSLSRSGALLYKSGVPEVDQVTLRDRTGDRVLVDITSGARVREFQFAPEGSRLALTRTARDDFLEVLDLETRRTTRLPGSAERIEAPRWTESGDSIVYVTEAGILSRRADGVGEPRVLLRQENVRVISLVPGGEEIVYESGGDLFRLRLGVDTVGTPLVATSAVERDPSVSPDGRWMAFMSDVSGAYEVYVVPYPDVEVGQTVVSGAGGHHPVWSRSTPELFYQDGRNTITATPYEVVPEFLPGQEVRLFRNSRRGTFDVDAEGDRFLVREYIDGESLETRLVYILNFAERLKDGGE